MRALCCGLPLEGHVRPLLPLGTALVEAGHEVRVATGLDLHARVREAGLIPVAAGPSFADAFAATAHLSGLGELSLIQRAPATFSRIFAPAKLPERAGLANVLDLLSKDGVTSAAYRPNTETR